MPRILINTYINAPIERCFDLSRSIDVHMLSTAGTNERAIAGRTSGLIEKGETVTWEAIHFGLKQQLSSVITEMAKPSFFVDEMIEGAFKSIHHEHHFKAENEGTVITDIFDYALPFGFVGRLFNALILKRYMWKLLTNRNHCIKHIAESDEWRMVLTQ